jgi:SAM-dependent methyltransferase
MRFGYEVRASLTMLRHPWQGVERVRGRIDRRRDKRQLGALGVRASDLYGAVADWQPRLHGALDLPWPCEAVAAFGQVWDRLVAELTDSGVHVGRASYGGWNDGDRAFAEAIWCIVAHLRPTAVVETGVAHGVTSRVILQGLERNGSGHLWSIDLPAVDPALHREIGIAVPEDVRHRWTYVEGTSRERLPHLLTELGELQLFVHDSLHTGHNLRFELESAWAAMPSGGVAVVDDIDHSLGFRNFLDQAGPRAWFVARHVTGGGLWGVATKAAQVEPSSHSPGLRAPRKRQPRGHGGGTRAANLRAVTTDPGCTALTPSGSTYPGRERRHQRIERAVVREIAYLLKTLAGPQSRLLEIQAEQGRQTLLFGDQLARPERPVIYDQEDRRAPEASPDTDFAKVDVEAAEFPAPDDRFDVVVWNRDLVTVKNILPALRETRRVLRPGGLLIIAVPNLAALHNRLLLLAGRQPTTLHINNGDHVRGFTIPSMTRFLERDLEFRTLQVIGVGLAPITGAVLPRPVRGLSHTVVWVLRAGAADGGNHTDSHGHRRPVKPEMARAASR